MFIQYMEIFVLHNINYCLTQYYYRLHPTRDETFALSIGIWVMVTNLPDKATGYSNSVTLSQCSILPHNILPVFCVAELSVALPWVLKISHCLDIIPDPSGKAQDPLLQNIGFHMWQYGNTGVMMLPTALSFHICRYFSALLADTPGGLTSNRRAQWRSICWCHMENIKLHAWVTCHVMWLF